MRIISGKYKGRMIDQVQSDQTKETSDRVRQAIFNVLGGTIRGQVLDLFAGSGAYALEAISRGADHAVCVEHQRIAYVTILNNAKKLDAISYMQIHLMDAHVYLNHTSDRFDYMFIDPPYAYLDYDGLIMKLIHLLNPSGIIILETHKKTMLKDDYDDLSKIFERIYGIKKVTMYQRDL